MVYENSGDECVDYKWYQTDKDLTCEIRILHLHRKHMESIGCFESENVCINEVKRLLKVEMKANSIQIFIGGECIFSKELYLEINVEYSTWYIEDGSDFLKKKKKETESLNLVLVLEKRRPSIWSKCFKQDRSVDLSRITSTKNFSELDDRSKMDIMRTVCGGGRSENDANNIQDILKKAWNEKNSPFKGIEYDPELVKRMLT
ncbi:hypothetical protein FG386_002858 [Cryptosporidium ryanae]|uniref:uncharacterized protein n=1 Tax=Cryptosporidium ryanae TaxID=515981 RepID=UPI00351A8195|nr:hypothetical protein FG386_002858 [Cryptosporidium ryanae]